MCEWRQVYVREITDEVGTSGVDFDNNEASLRCCRALSERGALTGAR